MAATHHCNIAHGPNTTSCCSVSPGMPLTTEQCAVHNPCANVAVVPSGANVPIQNPNGAVPQNNPTPKLTVWIGPMMAGKTLNLINTYKTSPHPCIAIKPAIDTRSNGYRILAHNGEFIPAVPLNNLQDIETITEDEGQFFIDLAEKCHVLLTMGKNVYVSGLSANARQKPWQSISEIMAMADDIVFLRCAKCQVCQTSPGSHTMLIPNANNQKKFEPTIKIGGAETYRTVCRKCLM